MLPAQDRPARDADNGAIASGTSPVVPPSTDGPDQVPAGPQDAPEDAIDADASPMQRHLATLAMFMLGATFLLPWNAILVSSSYIHYRVIGSPFDRSFLSYISVVFLAANLGFMLLANLTQANASMPRRIVYSAVPIVVLTLLMALTTLPKYISPSPFFLALMMPLCVLFPWASSFMQNAVVALASWFGPSCLQANMVGQAVIAVVVSIVQLAAAIGTVVGARKGNQGPDGPSGPDDGTRLRHSALIFFLFSTAFALVSIAIYALLVRTSLFKRVAASRKSLAVDKGAAPKVDILLVMRKTKLLGLSVFWTFLVTLCVFPAITASILSVNDPLHSAAARGERPPLWSDPVVFVAIHFLVFNIGDWLGRLLPGIPGLLLQKEWQLVTMTLVRTVCVPLFAACNIVSGADGEPRSKPLFNSDIVFIVILLAFAISNGYLGELALCCSVSDAYAQRRYTYHDGGRQTSFAGEARNRRAPSVLSFPSARSDQGRRPPRLP